MLGQVQFLQAGGEAQSVDEPEEKHHGEAERVQLRLKDISRAMIMIERAIPWLHEPEAK